MTNIPTTSTTLLCDVASDSQHVRWGEFVARYRPMMEAFMRERFPSLDADDVIQETLIAVCAALPSYRYMPEEITILPASSETRRSGNSTMTSDKRRLPKKCGGRVATRRKA